MTIAIDTYIKVDAGAASTIARQPCLLVGNSDNGRGTTSGIYTDLAQVRAHYSVLSPEYTFAEQYFANNNGELLIATIGGGNSGDGGGGGGSGYGGNTLSWGLLVNQGGSGTLATPITEETLNGGFYQFFGGYLGQADTYNDTVPTYNIGLGEYAFPIRAANPFNPLNIRIQRSDYNGATGLHEWTTIYAAGAATTSSFSVVSTQAWAQDKELYIVLIANTPQEHANYRAQLLDNSGAVLSTIEASLGYFEFYD
jgi:hypothetical protein